MDSEHLMRRAIAMARQGIEAGQSPFGCVIAQGERIVACRHNMVLATTDITAHAEVVALRAACGELGRVLLDDCVAASTCEPCPMCMAALHWARVHTVYYGATIDDAAAAGFNELKLPARQVLALGQSPVELVSGVLRAECRELFTLWRRHPNHQTY